MTSHPEHVTGSHGRGERHVTVEVENRRKNSTGLMKNAETAQRCQLHKFAA